MEPLYTDEITEVLAGTPEPVKTFTIFDDSSVMREFDEMESPAYDISQIEERICGIEY